MTVDRKPQAVSKTIISFLSPTALVILQNKTGNELYQIHGKQGQQFYPSKTIFSVHIQSHSRRRAKNKIKKFMFWYPRFQFNFNSIHASPVLPERKKSK